MKSRDSFIFYRSIFESAKALQPEDRLKFYEAVMQFSLDFKEPKIYGIVGAMFCLLRPTLDKSNKGYIAGKKASHSKHPARVPAKDPADNKDKDKDEDKDEDKVFTFTLKSKRGFDVLGIIYTNKLKEYIKASKYNLSYEVFSESCIANGYKYKNFSFAYNNWAKKEFDNTIPSKNDGVQLWG